MISQHKTVEREREMESFYACLKAADQWNKYGYEVEFFWLSGVILVFVGFFGFAGNIATLFVLGQKKFRNKVFYNLLIELACFDILSIVSLCVEVGYRSMACTKKYVESVIDISYLIMNIGLCGSIYTTIAVSVERYLRMHFPTRGSYKRKSWMYITPVVSITLVYNSPRFFKYHYSIVNGTLVTVSSNWTETGVYEVVYVTWIQTFVESIIPMIILLFLNGSMIVKMYCSTKNDTDEIINKKKDKKRKATTKILFGIYFVFLLSHIPSSIVYMLDHFGRSENVREKWYFLKPIEYLAVLFNSSINFVIYCLAGTKFRNEFYNLFRRKSSATKISLNTTTVDNT